jgi:hypothetical protein
LRAWSALRAGTLISKVTNLSISDDDEMTVVVFVLALEELCKLTVSLRVPSCSSISLLLIYPWAYDEKIEKHPSHVTAGFHHSHMTVIAQSGSDFVYTGEVDASPYSDPS